MENEPANPGELPPTFWLGKIGTEWPIHTFVAESQVISWLEEVDGTTLKSRRAWQVSNWRDGAAHVKEVKVVVTPSRLVDA